MSDSVMVDVPLHDGGGGSKLVDVVGGAPKKVKSKPNYREGQIYELRNTVNDIVYIGATVQTLKKRFGEHKSHAREGTGSTTFISQSMRELGVEKFSIHHVDWVPSDSKRQLDEYELLWIWNYKTNGIPLYNTQFDLDAVGQSSGMVGVIDRPKYNRWQVTVGMKKRLRDVKEYFPYGEGDKQTELGNARQRRVEYLASIGQEPVYTSGEGLHQQHVTQGYMERDPCPPPPPPTPVPRAKRIGSCLIHVDQLGECDCDDDLLVEEWTNESTLQEFTTRVEGVLLPLPDPAGFPHEQGDGEVIDLLSD